MEESLKELRSSEHKEFLCVQRFAVMFRDIADTNYISARLCFKSGLYLQHVVLSHQTIELYLKSLFLFNGKSLFINEKGKKTKYLGHTLCEIIDHFNKVNNTLFSIHLSEEVLNYISRINELGFNRYLSKPLYLRQEFFSLFDESIRQIRPYCQFLRLRKYSCDGNISLLNNHLKKITECIESPNLAYPINSGYIENMLKSGKPVSQLEALVWKNNVYKSSVFKDFGDDDLILHQFLPPQFRDSFKQSDKDIIQYYIPNVSFLDDPSS